MVMTMEITLFIPFRTRKFTTGLNKTAIIIAKTSGMMMSRAMYKIANKAKNPTNRMVAFA